MATEISKRFQTLPLEKIDHQSLGLEITKQWRKANDDRDDLLAKREDWTANWRDLNGQRTQGPWENSSDFKIPITLIDGKAIHARLWQLFSDRTNFFKVKARKEVFEDREETIKQFMQFILWDYCNSKHGATDTFDECLWDNVFEGSAYLKLYWKREIHTYLEVVPVVSTQETMIIDRNSLTGQTKVDTIFEEKEVVKEDILETPQIRRCLLEDVVLPQGENDPQTSRWVKHRVFMTDEDLKLRAQEGKFDKEVVQYVFDHKRCYGHGSNEDQIKELRATLDGYSDSEGYFEGLHAVIEHYGKIYVEKELTEETEKDIEKIPQEVVIWVHQASSKVLGWTYLHRISPGGVRPLFKWDFIRFPDRNQGVGVAEVLAPIQQAIDATYNLRQDNGVLASTPFGVYRAGSGIKPDKIRTEPGTFFPVDDVNDIKAFQMPYLSGFGYQEEDRLNSYAERLLTISDLNLGRSPAKVGLFRTASGANTVQTESGIQLEIHFDRIARSLSRMLQALFRLARERVPAELYYRITGENGEPIFGKVNRKDLMGEFDFEISVDVLGESRIEGQQKAVLMMQTLINPAFTQTGVISPTNLYHLAKNFLMKNRMTRIDNYITQPQDYQGDVVTASERVFRIAVNAYTNPPVEDTVRLQEDHEKALKVYDGFEKSDAYGLLATPEQLAALQRLKEKHMQYLMAQQAGGNPNMTGMQTPRDGFAPVEAGGTSAGTLGAPMGEPNGPVV